MSLSPKMGAAYTPDSTKFSVFSEHAQKIELCLFSVDEKTEKRIPLRKNEDNIWSAEVSDIRPGQKYGYRAYGEYNPEKGLFFNPHKLAIPIVSMSREKLKTGRMTICALITV